MSATYQVWGAEHIESVITKEKPNNPFTQMDAAVALPVAVAGALMPDAHLGYGLPIGGVLALDNAVCPYAVGVDIACRMKLSIFNIPPSELEAERDHFIWALERGTFFGVGVENNRRYDHPVLDMLFWSHSPAIAENQEKARRQLGTSGSGNHFVEWGVLSIGEDRVHRAGWGANPLQKTPGPGRYVALMSHSGSRGTGAAVCNYYSKIAKAMRPEFGDLAYFTLDSQAGQEYWDAMTLMGEYAAANHDCIHNEIANLLLAKPVYQIENHHNFAWKEQHHGRELVVHRKGATPASAGVLGVIPGSMGTPAYVVEGLGNADSLHSASHGAGRVMSRKAAKKAFSYRAEIDRLAGQGVTVLSAGVDEVVGVYKDIHTVMAAQTDLVRPLARFDPKIVKMCGSNDRAED